MVRKDIVIRNEFGLPTRAAAAFVTEARRFESRIGVSSGNREEDGKSLVGMMLLTGGRPCRLTITADGHDGDEAVAVLADFVERFDGKTYGL